MKKQQAGPPLRRSQSQTGPLGSNGRPLPILPPAGTRRPRADEAPWQRAYPRGLGRIASLGGLTGKTVLTGTEMLVPGNLQNLDASHVGEELMRIGSWSVCRPVGHSTGLIFLHLDTGIVESIPPEEVLVELEMQEPEDDTSRPSSRSRPQSSRSRPQSGRSSRDGGSATAAPKAEVAVLERPSFKRIVLGNGHEMPLAMARDIHAALREDASIFDAARLRFSDNPNEPALEISGLPEELGDVASALALGEFSRVIGTEAGMQIVLRVC